MVCKDLRCLSGDRVHQGLFGTTSYCQGNWTKWTTTKTKRVVVLVVTLTLKLELHHPTPPSREAAPTAATAPEKSRRRSSLPLPSSLLAASAALSGKQGKRAVLSIDQGRFFLVAGDGGSCSSSTRSVYVHLRFRVWVWVRIWE